MIRSLLVRSLCAAILVSALFVSGAAHAQSNGVPPLAGQWTGKVTDIYWDQTSLGSVKPKKKFKSNVTVTIAQASDQITVTITFNPNFPLNSGTSISQIVLDGYAGNYHASASMSAGPAVTLSGVSNKSGTSLSLTGVAASTEFTHELKFKLKKQSP